MVIHQVITNREVILVQRHPLPTNLVALLTPPTTPRHNNPPSTPTLNPHLNLTNQPLKIHNTAPLPPVNTNNLRTEEYHIKIPTAATPLLNNILRQEVIPLLPHMADPHQALGTSHNHSMVTSKVCITQSTQEAFTETSLLQHQWGPTLAKVRTHHTAELLLPGMADNHNRDGN
jgi:hypothetical protein